MKFCAQIVNDGVG